METGIYLGTAALTIIWSVWIYRVWSHRARLRESDAGRFYHIIAPSGYFVVLALAGWERARVIRLDLIGVVAYDGIILLGAIALLIASALKHIDFRRTFRRILVAYNLLAVLLVAALYLVKFFPPALIGFAHLLRQLTELDFFRFAWVGLDPESHQQDLVSMANKVLIALLSYIPVSLARALYVSRQMSRQRREVHDELAGLRQRVERLERRLAVDGIPRERGEGRTAEAAASQTAHSSQAAQSGPVRRAVSPDARARGPAPPTGADANKAAPSPPDG